MDQSHINILLQDYRQELREKNSVNEQRDREKTLRQSDKRQRAAAMMVTVCN